MAAISVTGKVAGEGGDVERDRVAGAVRRFWRPRHKAWQQSALVEGKREMMDRPRVGTSTWTEADDQRLRSVALSGMTSREIAREIGRSISAVQARGQKARGFAETGDSQAAFVELG